MTTLRTMRFAVDGTLISDTVEDVAEAPPPPDAAIAAARDALARLDAIPTPLLTLDIVDVLADVRTALGGDHA